ncbi:MAG TPA: carboxypeptidase-like regulatory domain-containing protein, partial [Phycisphaerae bacterium]|nr:carboxypeptidase-like regulatory domain-containing protein [Phycisphaerae bacterium]
KAVAGVRVGVMTLGARQARSEVATGKDGAWEFMAADGGTRELTFDGTGYGRAWREVEGGAVQELFGKEMRVVLGKGTVVAGRVVDEDGKAVAGAKVTTLVDEKDEDGNWRYAGRGVGTRTGADGRYRVEGVPVGSRVGVEVEAPGYAAYESPKDGLNAETIAAGRDDVDVTMARGGTLRVRLMRDGKALKEAGWEVAASSVGEPRRYGGGVTDGEGVALLGVAAGRYEVRGESAAGWGRTWEPGVAVKVGETVDVMVHEDTWVTVRGVVRDAATGAGVAERLDVGTKGGPPVEAEVMPDAEGKFEVHLREGEYGAGLGGTSASVYPRQDVDFAAKAGMGELEIALHAGRVVRGQLVDEKGKGVAGYVEVMGLVFRTDGEGKYVLPEETVAYALGQGHPVLLVDGKKREALAVEDEAALDGGGVELVAMGSVTGRLMDEGGKGVAGATIKVEVEGAGERTREPKYALWDVAVDGEGRFRVAPVPVGYHVVLVAKGKGLWARKDVGMVGPGEEVTEGDVVMTEQE